MRHPVIDADGSVMDYPHDDAEFPGSVELFRQRKDISE